jgi:glycosyltransferase involved in cell wall biosynthesis
MGGHSEVLRLWLKLIAGRPNTSQFVIASYAISPEFSSKIESDDIVFQTVDGEDLTRRIQAVVETIMRIRPDTIIAFIHPTDIGALVALNVIRKSLPAKILFYDHADNAFWLGKRTIDVLIEFCRSRADFSRKYRAFRGKIAIIPFTTDIAEREGTSDDHGRRAEGRTVSLSVGSMVKVQRDGFWDYFGTIRRILETNPNHIHIFLAGGSKNGENGLNGWPQDLSKRLIVQYNVRQATRYYKEADFLIETFPFTGGQVRIEAMACGLPVICVLNPRFAFTLWHSGIGEVRGEYPFVAECNADIVNHAKALIRDRELRRRWGNFLRGLFEQRFSPRQVSDRLKLLMMNDESIYDDWDAREVNVPRVDGEYLFELDLKRGGKPSPFMSVLSSWRKMRGIRCRALGESLSNLEIDDWAWFLRGMKEHLGRMAEWRSWRFVGRVGKRFRRD